MARPPKCRFCGRVEWNHVCNPGLRGEPKPEGDKERGTSSSRRAHPGVPSAPSLAQVQAEKEATFTALVTGRDTKLKVGRPKRYKTDAERQKAYRERKRALLS